MRVYIAGPYTARRRTCVGCLPRAGDNLCANAEISIGGNLKPGPDCDAVDVEQRDTNVRRADEAGREVARRGHTPFIPHKMTWDWERDRTLKYDDFLRIDDEWLRLCHALLYLGPSPGADRELVLARAVGMQVFMSLDEVPNLRGTMPKERSEGP